MEDNGTSGVNFHEEHQVPFCEPFQCRTTLPNRTDGGRVVLWDCVPVHCKAYVLTFLGVIIMLAAMTIVFNCLIIGINLAAKTRRIRRRNPIMSNYSVYVVSLAIADLLVGVVVLPLCLVNFYLEFLVNELNGPTSFASGEGQGPNVQPRITGTSRGAATMEPTEVQVANEHNAAAVVRAALGVFTHLTLFVSIYTLITASADRLYAANNTAPFSSSQLAKSSGDKTKTSWIRETVRSMRRSTIAVFVVWVLGIVFAVLPLFLGSELHFRHVGHIFAAMTSDKNYSIAVRGYLSTLVLPLIGIWLLNVAICFTLWQRKSQLGLLRKKSLRRKNSSNRSENKLPPSPRLLSNSDSVFEPSPMESYVLQKYPASRWNQSASADDRETGPLVGGLHPIYRNNPNNVSETAIRSPASPRSPSSQWETRSSVLRRKVSSIRRAKEMLQKQSFEANITKTLCIVVVAFTAAVLPLIVTLSMVSVEDDSTPEALNGEVTALTLSLLLLFSNSFVNCVIYGARMRDFRTSLCQLFRTFADKIKNTFCGCCVGRNDAFASEVVNGVFLMTKKQRADTGTRSPSVNRSGGTFERFKFLSRSSSRKPLNCEATLGKTENSSEYGNEQPSVAFRKDCYPMPTTQLAPREARNARPSSSGYRTDPEPISVHEDGSKNRNSQRSDVGETITEDLATEEALASHRGDDTSPNTAATFFKLDAARGKQDNRCSSPSDTDTKIDSKSPAHHLTERLSGYESPCKSDDFKVADDDPRGVFAREGLPDAFAEDNLSRDCGRSANLTLDIDFSRFSSL